ncbi:MAG: CvpA family protein [Flavobacteriales bacterium]
MNFLDYLILGLLLWGFIAGYRRGLIMILCALAGVILGGVFALKYMGQAGEKLSGYIHFGLKFSEFLAFLLIFTSVYVGFFFLGKSMSKAISLVMLGFVNRFSGGIFGMLKYFVLISIFMGLVNYYNVQLFNEDIKKSSAIYASVNELSQVIAPEVEKIKRVGAVLE